MRCTLYGFITDYVKDIFVEEILFDIREKLSEVTQGTVQFIDCFQRHDFVAIVPLMEGILFGMRESGGRYPWYIGDNCQRQDFFNFFGSGRFGFPRQTSALLSAWRKKN